MATTSPSQRTRPISSPPARRRGRRRAGPALRCTRDVVDRAPGPVRAPDRDRRQLERLELAREGALEVLGEAVGVDRGEEADLAVVDGEHRDAGAGVAAQRGEDRAVAAEHDAEVDVVAQLGDDLDERAGSIPCLAASSVVKRSVMRRRRGDLDQRRARPPRCRRAAGG